jgi:hypothetical protein
MGNMGGVSLAIMQSIHENQFYLTVIFTLGLKKMDQNTLEFLHKSHFFQVVLLPREELPWPPWSHLVPLSPQMPPNNHLTTPKYYLIKK